MRISFLFITLISFFSFTLSGQYTWKQKGVKTLVGKERGYFGTETRPEELKKIACGCEPHADYSNQGLKFLGNLSPDMGENGKGIFWNFDKQGRAHLTELDGKDQVFLKGNCVYAYACGNLLKQEELFQNSPAPEKNMSYDPPVKKEERYEAPAPKPVVREEPMIWVKEIYSQESLKSAQRCTWMGPNYRPSSDGSANSGVYFQVPLSELDEWRTKEKIIITGRYRRVYTYMTFSPVDYYTFGVHRG